MRVLIVGGYGTFGGRLARLLAEDGRCTLFIGGRDAAAAARFCERQTGPFRMVPVLIDRHEPEDVLRRLRPAIVVDASGPFQAYGENPLRLVRACLEAGAHYLDLADSAGFPAAVAALDPLAKRTARFALSGMSSFPALSAAAVRHLARGLGRPVNIAAGVSPSPFAGVGLSVIRAVASYAGQPVVLWKDGRWQEAPGLIDGRRLIISVPGEVPLGPFRFSLVAVPDPLLFPADWPALKRVWTGAAPRPVLLHRLLWIAAWMVRLRLLASLAPFARLMDRTVNLLSWGDPRGGMTVSVTDARGTERSWHLLAPGDSGPFVPAMAAAAVIRRCLAGSPPAPGARPGHRDVDLADFAPLFEALNIRTGVRGDCSGRVYPDALGDAFTRLSPVLRDFHEARSHAIWAGRATVRGGTNKASRAIAALFGFPAAQGDVPVTVRVVQQDGHETWLRDFGGARFQSQHRACVGRWSGCVEERFGPVRFRIATVERDGQLQLVMQGWSFLGVPLPRALMPRSRVSERQEGSAFVFDVEVSLPLLGRLIHYVGMLEPPAAG